MPRTLLERLSADRWVALALAGVLALPFLGTPRAQFGDDDLEYAVPFSHFVLEELGAGRWPVWNPATDAGVPLTVQQPWMGPAYPGLALFAVLSDGRALAMGYGLHAALYGVGIFLLLRRLGLGRPGAVLGALAVGLGSDVAMAWNRGYLHHLVAVSWLPWPILAMEHARSSTRPAAPIALGALAVGASFLGGHPVSAMQMLLAAGSWCALAAVVDLRAGGAARAGRTLGLGAAMALGGLACAALQLVPLAALSGAEGSLDAVRPYKPWDAEMARPWRRLGYLLPGWGEGHKGREFVGLVVVLLAPLGLASITTGARHRAGVGAAALSAGLASESVSGLSRALPALGTAALFALLSAGPHLPVLGWLRSLLPPLGAVSYSYFFMPPVHLGLAWLAALGLDRGLRPDRKLVPRVLASLAMAALGLVVGFALARAPLRTDSLDPEGWGASLLPAAAVALALGALLLAGASTRFRPARIAWGVVALALVELVAFRIVARVDKPPYESARYFTDSPLLDGVDSTASRILHVQDRARVADWALRRNGGMILGYDEVRRSARLGWEPYHALTRGLPAWWIDWEAALVRDDRPHEAEALLIDEARLAILDRLAVGHILSDTPLTGPAAGAYRLAVTEGSVHRYDRREATPRVSALPEGEVQIVARAASRWHIRVEAPGPTRLLLREAAIEGWSATVNGAETELDDEEATFVAVVLPAGSHEVVLAYHPARWPIATSGIAIAALSGLVLLRARRRR